MAVRRAAGTGRPVGGGHDRVEGAHRRLLAVWWGRRHSGSRELDVVEWQRLETLHGRREIHVFLDRSVLGLPIRCGRSDRLRGRGRHRRLRSTGLLDVNRRPGLVGVGEARRQRLRTGWRSRPQRWAARRDRGGRLSLRGRSEHGGVDLERRPIVGAIRSSSLGSRVESLDGRWPRAYRGRYVMRQPIVWGHGLDVDGWPGVDGRARPGCVRRGWHAGRPCCQQHARRCRRSDR